MSLKTSKKILKVAGVLTIIGAILSLVISLSAVILGVVGTTMPDFLSDNAFLKDVITLLTGGVVYTISGALSLFEGIASVNAANNGKHATAAWVFSILSVIGAAFSSYDMFKNDGFTASTITSVVVSVLLSVLIFCAASNVRKNAKGIN